MTAPTVLRVPVCERLMSLNDRDHRMRVHSLTAEWKRTASVVACTLGPPALRRHPPCLVRTSLPFTTERVRDAHNYYPTVKAIIDGFVTAGIWPDDHGGWVVTEEPTMRVDPHGPVIVELDPELHPSASAHRTELLAQVRAELDDYDRAVPAVLRPGQRGLRETALVERLIRIVNG